MNNNYKNRSAVICAVIIAVGLIFIVRLLFLQIVTDQYRTLSEGNSHRIQTEFPSRGLILDRNGKIMVDNELSYDLWVTPRNVKEFDTTELISILGIDKTTLESALERCRNYSPYRASILIPQITSDKYATLQEKLHKYDGFETHTRMQRAYNIHHSADLFGYVGEVSQADIQNDPTGFYIMGDNIGVTGLEKAYEPYLRGIKGERHLLVDNFNRTVGIYAGGAYDVPARIGQSLTTTIDADLQDYAYSLMQGKRGGIVAIDPSTGEILLKISTPGYDPALLVGAERGLNFRALEEDKGLPLFDRTLQATYPPGSTFKTLQALTGLQNGVITERSTYQCHGGWSFGSLHMNCHIHTSPLDLRGGIQNSCNPYFVQVWQRILEDPKYGNVRNSYAHWREQILQFGMGVKITPEFPSASEGLIPTVEYFDKRFKTERWRWSYLMSMAIGQGEILASPMQIANLACCIANRGYYITPHAVRAIGDSTLTFERHDIDIDREHFELVVDGMAMAVAAGTARGGALDSIAICGKTGTAQNPHGRDHSVFMVFAPKENPKIAMAVYIENGGWGATYAVPIGSLIMEKYLSGKISNRRKYLENYIREASISYTE